MKFVLVTGGRDHPSAKTISHRLSELRPDVVIHGGRGNADNAASRWAKRNAAELVCPYIGRLGKQGGPTRNFLMVRLLASLKRDGNHVAVEAFPTKRSKGTWHCVRVAADFGLVATIHRGEL